MRAKITLPSLVTMLSRSSGMSKKVAEEFVREFCSLIISALETDRIVKIKSLGTFKLISVEPRKSVDVNTGEDTLIAGHTKITFVASKELAARVNLPFEAFEPVEIESGVVFSDSESEPEETEASEEADMDVADQEDAEEAIEETVVEDEKRVYSATLNTIYNMEDGVEKEIESEAENDEMMLLSEQAPDNDESVSESVNAEDAESEEVVEPTPEIEEYKESEDEISTDDASEVAKKEEENREVNEPMIREVVVRSDYVPEDDPSRHRHKFAKGFVVGFLSCIAVFALAFAGAYLLFLHNYGSLEKYLSIGNRESMAELVDKSETDSIDVVALTEEVSPAEEVSDGAGGPKEVKPVEEVKSSGVGDEKVDTRESDKPVYDTISRTRYLTTMAKEHYGNYNLWPYIYEENKEKLGHPDRIRPGTVVVIPSLDKYGVNPNNPVDVTKAKRMGVQIYARYK